MEAYSSLPTGAIAYPDRMTMNQGRAGAVIVRVGSISNFPTGDIPGSIALEPAKISRFTVACLSSQPGQFLLVRARGEAINSAVCEDDGCSCLRQTLVGDAADFEWSATPLESGDLKLHLRVAARLFLSGSKEESHDVLSKHGLVHVHADTWFVASTFIESSWKEVLASVGGVGAVWAFAQRLLAGRSEPVRQAGFGRGRRTRSGSLVNRLWKSIKP